VQQAPLVSQDGLAQQAHLDRQRIRVRLVTLVHKVILALLVLKVILGKSGLRAPLVVLAPLEHLGLRLTLELLVILALLVLQVQLGRLELLGQLGYRVHQVLLVEQALLAPPVRQE
jgi:hypothetical protein